MRPYRESGNSLFAVRLVQSSWVYVFGVDCGRVAAILHELPKFADGANVVFIISATEDPERKPARAAGFHGGRYISVEASARGEWEAGHSRSGSLKTVGKFYEDFSGNRDEYPASS
jgi:hypothetical protein